MSFHLMKEESVEEGIRRILVEQVVGLREDLQNNNLEEATHEARKRCKRIRASIRLLKPLAKTFYRQENSAFRAMAHSLSSTRDIKAGNDAFSNLVMLEKGMAQHFSSLRILLKSSQKQMSAAAQKRKLTNMKGKTGQHERRLSRFELPEGLDFMLIEKGLYQSYRLGRECMDTAFDQNDDVTFHEWRKRVKDLGYQIQILLNLWPPVLKRFRSELEELGDLLGQEHDLIIVRKTILKNAGQKISNGLFHSFFDLLERRVRELKLEAKEIGRRIYAEKPKAFMRRIRTYWEVWRAEVSAASANEP